MLSKPTVDLMELLSKLVKQEQNETTSNRVESG